jgi:hypothetical protein
MNEKCTNSIVQCAKHPLSFTILGGCVGTQSPEKDAVASQKGGCGMVKKLPPIIGLKTTHRTTELCVSVRNKLSNMLMNFRFMAQRKYPAVMGKIMN